MNFFCTAIHVWRCHDTLTFKYLYSNTNSQNAASSSVRPSSLTRYETKPQLEVSRQSSTHRICSAQTIALFQICCNQVFHIKEIGLKFLLQLTLAELHFCVVPVVLYLFSVKLYGIHTMIFFYTFDSVSSVIYNFLHTLIFHCP